MAEEGFIMALGAILGAAAKYGAIPLAGFVASKLFGRKRGKKGRAAKGGMELPGGGTAANIPTLPPAAQRELESLMPQILQEFKAEPQKFPELAELVQQARDTFGPMEFEQMVPELKDLPPVPEMPPEADLKELDFGPIEARARRQFAQETLPSIAERFTALTGGGQRAGAFERQKAQAGSELEENLAALRATMEPEYALKRAQYGLERGKLGAVLGQLGLQRGQTENVLGLQRGQLMANLGMAQRRQGFNEAQMALQRAQAAQGPAQFRQSLLANILTGGVASPYHTAVQPARPSFLQGMAPGIGAGLGGLMGGLGQAAGSWLFGGSKTGMFK